MHPEFLTIKEVAVIFNVHRTTILRAVHEGFIVAIRVGNGPRSPYRISRKSIDAIHSSILHKLAGMAKPK
jgi:excisionase family DNA binding protein